MQLSRVLFLTPEKTYERKVKEIILAFQIEKNFTKEEIFTLYCNQVYFGHGNYGVEATSQFLFDKSIKDLTLAEAALVAGLPQNPSRLSPARAARARAAAPQPRAAADAGGEVHLERGGAAGHGRSRSRLNLHKDPPLDRALLPGGDPQVPGARVRQPAHLPGRPARLHHARPGPAAGGRRPRCSRACAGWTAGRAASCGPRPRS